MDLKFENGSEIHTIKSCDNVRGKRAELAIKQGVEYFRKRPSVYVEMVMGRKPPLWQRIWMDSILPLIGRMIRKF